MSDIKRIVVPIQGMELRDWFAGQVVAAVLDVNAPRSLGDRLTDAVAATAYRVADAMMRARGGAA